MATSEPADERDLPTSSLGLEFLTSKKQNKSKEKEKREQTGPVSSCLAKLLIFRRQFRFSQRENTPFRNDKLKEKLLRNTQQFQQQKYDN